jgi:hypothetical protein
MALDNLITVVFTDEEIAETDSAMTKIKSILECKVVNLTPKQRQSYGRVAYENEIWVDKTFGNVENLLLIFWHYRISF